MPGPGLGAFDPGVHLHSHPSQLALSLTCNSKIQKALQNKRFFLTRLLAKPDCLYSPSCGVNIHHFLVEIFVFGHRLLLIMYTVYSLKYTNY